VTLPSPQPPGISASGDMITVTGVPVIINAQALNTSAFELDANTISETAGTSFPVSLLPGVHGLANLNGTPVGSSVDFIVNQDQSLTVTQMTGWQATVQEIQGIYSLVLTPTSSGVVLPAATPGFAAAGNRSATPAGKAGESPLFGVRATVQITVGGPRISIFHDDSERIETVPPISTLPPAARAGGLGRERLDAALASNSLAEVSESLTLALSLTSSDGALPAGAAGFAAAGNRWATPVGQTGEYPAFGGRAADWSTTGDPLISIPQEESEGLEAVPLVSNLQPAAGAGLGWEALDSLFANDSFGSFQ
jgi:hypothetical protein